MKSSHNSIHTPHQLQFQRFFLLVLGCVSFGCLLVIRLVDVQLRRGDEFLAQAQGNRTHTLAIPAERGLFLDRFGMPLVFNTKQYRLLPPSESPQDEERVVDHDEAVRYLATESARVAYRLERQYPYAQALAHTLGYIGTVTAEDLMSDATLNPQQKIGKAGLEREFERQLRGVAGEELFEVNARGQRLRKLSSKPSVPGATISTTLDPYLSGEALMALGSQRGAVIILDAATGEILTAVSSPTFNPNLLSTTESDPKLETQRRRTVQNLFENPEKIFFNRAVGGGYPPGSVFKVVTALAGLEEGALTAETTVTDEGVLKVGEFEYRTWFFTQHGGTDGVIALVRALARSNDIYFYKAAEWIGPEDLAAMAQRFGFGEKTGVEIGGETAGLVPTPIWKEQATGERWFLGNTYHFGIGQGDLLVSPLQVAQSIQAIAHNGTLCRPTFIKGSPERCREVGVREEHLDLVLTGMLDACSAGGTASRFFAYNAQRRAAGGSSEDQIRAGAVACKTGTAEFGAKDGQGNRKTHGWFTAIAAVTPATASAQIRLEAESLKRQNAWSEQVQKTSFPEQLVFVVLVESDDTHPQSEGSREAAPIVKHLLDWMQGTSSDQTASASATVDASSSE